MPRGYSPPSCSAGCYNSNDIPEPSCSSRTTATRKPGLSLPPTCLELLLHDQNSSNRVPLFFPSLDVAFGGGLEGGGPVTEVLGPPGAGKTCFCLQLCASYLSGAFLSLPANGGIPSLEIVDPGASSVLYTASKRPKGCALYIDCDGGFRAERFLEIASGTLALCNSTNREKPEDFLQRLLVIRVFSVRELLQLLEGLVAPSIPGAPHRLDTLVPLLSFPASAAPESFQGAPRGPPIGLVVVDSLGSLFHPALHGSGWAAGKGILKTGFALVQLGAATGAVIAVATKIQASRAEGGGFLTFLSRAWAHFPSLRLRLSGPPTGSPLSSLREMEVLQYLDATDDSSANKSLSPLLIRVTPDGLREEAPLS